MRPVIGILCDTRLSTPASARLQPLLQDFANRDYATAVADAGGAPVLLPCRGEADIVECYLDRLDGLIVSGGDDMDPRLYREPPHLHLEMVDPARDALDLAIIPEALERRVPILAICKGIQSLNVVLGGTLYQDIRTELPGAIQHRQRAPWGHPAHDVTLEPGTRLAAILGRDVVGVNSHHHQGVKDLAVGLTPAGHTADGLTEAAELSDHPFCIAIQWHPEHMAAENDHARALFAALVEAAGLTRTG